MVNDVAQLTPHPPRPLRRARLLAGLTLDDVASVTGVSPARLSRAERRRYGRLSDAELMRLAQLYSCGLDEIVG